MAYKVASAVKEKVEVADQTAQHSAHPASTVYPTQAEHPAWRKRFNYWLLLPATLVAVTTTGVILWLRRRFSRGHN